MSDVKEFIKSLGGNKKVATKLGVSSGAVSHWISRQNIPARKAVILSELSKLTSNEKTTEQILREFTQGVTNE